MLDFSKQGSFGKLLRHHFFYSLKKANADQNDPNDLVHPLTDESGAAYNQLTEKGIKQKCKQLTTSNSS